MRGNGAVATKADNPLYDTPLDRFDWMALRDLAKSQNDFEPIEARAKTGDVMAERLVCIGLAEVGPCSAFYAEKGFRSGYRDTTWLLRHGTGRIS